MKTRFTSVDIKACVAELEKKYLGMRVANCYDIDSKTYLIKLAKPDMKATLLLESGNRINSTEFDWPKNISPSGFSMKLRKHLRTRRLESVRQLGSDRIVDLQFGSGEAAYHIILELYDRGNIVLTDFEYLILNILRPRTDNSQDVRFAVRENYPVHLAKQKEEAMDTDRLSAIILAAKEGDNLKRVLNPRLDFGPAVIEHVLLLTGFPANTRIGHEFQISRDLDKLLEALHEADRLMERTGRSTDKGYIIQRQEKKAVPVEGEVDTLHTYHEFHPMLYKQHEEQNFMEFESFNKAVDEFFSKMESQKLDLKVLQQEKSALKKLENVKRDHEKRIEALQRGQEHDAMKAQLIEMNLTLVDSAIRVIQSALANQIDWTEIQQLVKEAQAQGDPVAGTIKGLKLEHNHITLLLKDPYDYLNDDDDEEDRIKPMKVDIDLALSGYANARKYFDMRRHAASKEQKTVESSTKALKSAEKKTKQTLKDVAVAATINKARKTYWFEKFLWFISSENYVVVGGRDQQQNELLVKRHLRPGDLYVHADLHGASSVIIKSIAGEAVPPLTLNEAGTMAICNSAAWDARVVTSAWWVHHDQVSKTAPTGEYLSTGSFMIRGKKNFLPPCYLVYGFGFLYKLDEDSLFRHHGERRVRGIEDSVSVAAESESSEQTLEVSDGESSEDDQPSEPQLESIKEEKPVDDLEMGSNDLHPEHGDGTDEAVEKMAETLEPVKQEPAFPDTTIELQHVKGDTFTLQRSLSAVSGASHEDAEDEEAEAGSSTQSSVVRKGGRLSAKQRREMKKKKQQLSDCDISEDIAESSAPNITRVQEEVAEEEDEEEDRTPASKATISTESRTQPPAPKRGQKGKMKKMKEKYKDQDDEEKQMRMELLASAGSAKENKKKDKKNKQKERQLQQKQQQQQQRGKGPQVKGPLTLHDIKVETLTISETEAVKMPVEANPEDDAAGSDDEKQAILAGENIQPVEDVDIADSLTGMPHEEDSLLYAVPVCAPYSCMLSYKHKVKLTPGTSKRGKAAKSALHMYLHDKSTSPREKELLRVVKDTDLSRNMPGKVKVSAPNLHLHKNKKK